MKKYLIIPLLLTASSLFGLLSPINQSIREIESILENPDFTNSLGQKEIIAEINHVKNGYIITTQNYEMFVEVVYDEIQNIGPAQFRLIFHTPTPHKS